LDQGRKEHTRQQAISIRGEVYAHNLRTLVGDDVQETRVLMSEAVVILAPNNCGQEDVERSNLDTPLDLKTLLNPLAVLKKMST
jgi:hypothetical protein